MGKQHVSIFLFDGYSDWEIAYLMPELFKSEKIILKTFTLSGTAVVSAGGLNVNPDLSLADISAEEVSLLILPGGKAWEENKIHGLDGLADKLYTAGKPIAAICSGTTFLGQKGYLDGVKHTSNDLNYLKDLAPAYKGEGNYQSVLAVTDRNIITANGIAPIEFAVEVFKRIKLLSESDIEKWFQLFKNGIWSE
jgi:putative intracellular protease/amidase